MAANFSSLACDFFEPPQFFKDKITLVLMDAAKELPSSSDRDKRIQTLKDEVLAVQARNFNTERRSFTGIALFDFDSKDPFESYVAELAAKEVIDQRQGEMVIQSKKTKSASAATAAKEPERIAFRSVVVRNGKIGTQVFYSKGAPAAGEQDASGAASFRPLPTSMLKKTPAVEQSASRAHHRVTEKNKDKPAASTRNSSGKQEAEPAAPAASLNIPAPRRRKSSGKQEAEPAAARDESQHYPRWLGERALSNSEPLEVRKRAVNNSYCPPNILSQIAISRSCPKELRIEAIENKHCPASTLAALLREQDVGICMSAIRNPNCPTTHVVASHIDLIESAAASNPNCPPQYLTTFAQKSSARKSALQNKNCPADTVNAYAFNRMNDVRAIVAAHPKCNVVSRLLTDENEMVRAAAASNPNCGSQFLQQAAYQESIKVRIAALSNPNCPQNVVNAKAQSSDPILVRAAAALNPNCSASVVNALAQKSTEHYKNSGNCIYLIRMCALRNLKCDPSILRAEAYSSNLFVRAAAVSNPNCPVDVIEAKALSNEDWRVIYCALRNPNCPNSVRKDVLFGSGHVQARASAARVLGLAPDDVNYAGRGLYYVPDSKP